eukprot:GEMP01014400.1.p1 GENE.GEMP01014400.1~~GEMP01014400.1.p1  ORF type:complete len:487 (+),score=60.53 GEMP01014400.1:150-1610(+)
MELSECSTSYTLVSEEPPTDDKWTTLTMSFITMSSRNCISLIFSLVPEVVNIFIIGNVGSVEQLGAVGLGNAMQNGLALSVAFGLNTAFDTLTATSGGAGATRLSMLYLARGRIAVTLYFVLIFPVLWNTSCILVALHQSPVVAEYAHDYNRVSLIGLWFFFQWNALQRFLLSRGDNRFVTVVQVTVSTLHITWCYLYVNIWGLGNAGLGLANSTTWIIQSVILELYVRCRHKALGVEDARWMNLHFGREAWSGLLSYLAVAAPSGFLLWAEWTYWELLSIIAGLFGDAQLAAHVIAFNIMSLMFMLPYGLSATTSYFFGNAIGQGNASLARRYMRVSLSVSLVILFIAAAVTHICALQLSLFFTRDTAVLHYLVPLLMVVSFIQVPDGMRNQLSTFLRVCERQNVAATVVFVQNFVVGLMLALLFGFYWHGGVVGMWWACCCGVMFGFVLFSLLVYFTIDIDDVVQRARDRIERDDEQEPSLDGF